MSTHLSWDRELCTAWFAVAVENWSFVLPGSAPDYFTSEGLAGFTQLENLLDEMHKFTAK